MTWARGKAAFCAVHFAFFASAPTSSWAPAGPWVWAFAFATGVVSVLVVVGLHVLNPWKSVPWEPPSWGAPLLKEGAFQFVAFFHFAGFFFITYGLGMLVSIAIRGLGGADTACLLVSWGWGTVIGTHLCRRLYHSAFRPKALAGVQRRLTMQ